MRRRFFVKNFSENSAVLEGPSAYHLARVLRAEPGQLYELSDGARVFLARVEKVGRNVVDFALIDPVESRANPFLPVILLSIVKFDRFEWALEKATELGAAEIVPIASARSEKALIAAAPKRATRWQKILSESAQQARCLQPPNLQQVSKPAMAFQTCDAEIRILLSERSTAKPLKIILNGQTSGESRAEAPRVALAIGPEGGWTDEEFAVAEAALFHEASLGANILRTETAVVAALASVHLYFD